MITRMGTPLDVEDDRWYSAERVDLVNGNPLTAVKVRFRGIWLDVVHGEALNSYPVALVAGVQGISGNDDDYDVMTSVR